MVRKSDLFISVPTFFRCPISLDVMKSPVSLCTGVTYDRSSIQRWLDNGNNTCPATMQILHSKDFVPNHTLHRLIQIWSDSIRASSTAPTPSPPPMSSEKVRVLVAKVVNMKREVVDLELDVVVDCLKKIVAFGEVSEENRRFLVKIDGFVSAVLRLICNVEFVLVEVGVRVLDLIVFNKNKDWNDWSDGDRELMRRREFLDSIVLVLEKGGLNSRISSVRVLEIVSSIDSEAKIMIAENESVLSELIRLASETVHSAILTGLSGLIAVSSVHRRIKSKLVKAGAIHTLSKIISESTTTTTTTTTSSSSPSSSKTTTMIVEDAMKLLEMLSACKEGRTAICEDEICVGAIVQKMMKVSKVTTEHATVILWSVCYLFRDQKAQEVVCKRNGLTKLLLLMQSDCSPSVRQMCTDLIKIFRVNSKSCLSSYDTKTTHIMPF
ncbi:hypothetical protein Syun_013877 [Stephania yunnanensis]|uniref:U-box domain-containing protein n=1 Tax=Stephania yunnanensis TaxID=152371 RepID=A0AAP0JIF4_9MAGN